MQETLHDHMNDQVAGAIIQAAATIFAARIAAQPDNDERLREITGEEAEINFNRCVEIALNGLRHLRGTEP